MRPNFIKMIYKPYVEINHNHFLNLVYGRIKALDLFLKSISSKGSILGFSFWYTVNLFFFMIERIFVAPNSVRPLFFNLIIHCINLSA